MSENKNDNFYLNLTGLEPPREAETPAPVILLPESVSTAAFASPKPADSESESFAAAPEQQNAEQRPRSLAVEGILLKNEPITAEPPRGGKQKRRRAKTMWVGGVNRGTIVALLAVCVLLSLVLGFTGGLLAASTNPAEQPALASGETPAGTNAALVDSIRTAASGGQSLTPAQIAAVAADTVVEIVTEREVQVPDYGFWGWGGGGSSTHIVEGAGSGVIITADGYIITNNHVIENVSKIELTLRNGQNYSATLVATDAKTDVAVLKIDATGLTPAAIGDSKALSVGETAVVIGNPLGRLGGTVTSGIISALDRPISFAEENGATNVMNLLQTDAAVNNGNSGGGLFNQYGELVGIVVAKSGGVGVEGLGFAIPINDVREVIDDLISYGYARGRIALGVTLINIENEQAAYSYRVEEPGIYIYRVEQNSNAERAGLKQGDCLLNVNGVEIIDAGQVSEIVQKLSVGDKLSVIYKREGETYTVDIVMQETVPANLAATKTGS